MNFIKKNILLLFSLLFFAGNMQSQNTKIDSLKNELQIHKKEDTVKVDLLYKLAFKFFRRDLELTKFYLEKVDSLSNTLNYTKGKAKVLYLKGILESRKSNYKTSLSFFKQSLKHYKSIQDQNGIADVYVAFGITHFDLSQYEEALSSYKSALEIYKDLKNGYDVITCLINIGNANSELGRYDDAISNYKKALIKSEATNDEDGVSFVHGNLAVVYRRQGNYPLAIDYLNKSLEYNKKNDNTLSIANTLNNLGEVYTVIGKYDKALVYLDKSLIFSKQIENKNLISTVTGNIGSVYMQKKEYKKSLKFYDKSLEVSQKINHEKQTSICFHNIGAINLLFDNSLIARKNFIRAKDINQKIGSKNGLAFNYLGIAETYLHEKKYKKALYFTQKANKIAKELKLLDTQKKAEKLFSKIYKNTGKYKKAFESHQKFKILSDSLFNKKNIEKITQLEYEYKYKQKLDSASVRELKLTKTVKVTSQNLEKSQRSLLLGVISFLVITLILAAIIFFLKLRNEKSKTKNIVIEQKLLRSQMTPHFIFNSLSVLQGMILNKEEKKSISYLSKFSKLLRIILENSREKMVLLSQELTAIENYLALQNLENELYKYTILVDNIIDVTLFKVPPMLIQPFVENAIEHGFQNQKENRKIDIHLKYLNKNLICTITDNGIGIDSKKLKNKQHKKSLSTTITSERLKILSKDFKMKSSVTIEDRQKYKEQGTLVTLVIPYKIDVTS